MDHADVIERLELAAVEPGGLDRLMAGDTPTAAAVAGHLAGCAACATELERLHRAVPLLRDVVRTTPPADLRERTLAVVRERGVARVAVATPAVEATIVPTVTPPSPRRAALPWVAAIAAAVVISVVATSLLSGGRTDERVAGQDRVIAGLEGTISTMLAIASQPDATRVALTSTGTPGATGTLLFAPGTTDVVVLASGLPPAAAGQEYRCWVLVDGQRVDVGRMYDSGGLAYWTGEAPPLATVPAGTTFGVSLGPTDGSGVEADPVLVGEL